MNQDIAIRLLLVMLWGGAIYCLFLLTGGVQR
jgi:hypothetical protein